MLVLSHKKLEVYEIAMKLLKAAYDETGKFPKSELFGLVSQIRRAAVSVCCNIAEGASRVSRKEKMRFYIVARSSVVEIDTQLEIARILGYYETSKTDNFERYLESVFKLLSKMINNLNASIDLSANPH